MLYHGASGHSLRPGNEAREAAVDDDKVSLRHDYSRLIPEGGGILLIKLKRPSRPGSMCALC